MGKCYMLENGLRIQVTRNKHLSPKLAALLSKMFEAAYRQQIKSEPEEDDEGEHFIGTEELKMRRLPAWPKPGTIASVRRELKNQFKPGDRVFVIGDHPWASHAGTLIAFEPYGPEVFGWTGWRVKLDGNCGECYAKPNQLREGK